MDIKALLGITSDKLLLSFGETIYMVLLSLAIGTLIALPLAVVLYVTRKGGIYNNYFIHNIISTVINAIRSTPFIILLVCVMPLTKLIVGTRIGTKAAIVPLVIYIAPYLARLIENSLLEVNSGIIETAQAMGASPIQIIIHFILPESMSSVILSLTTGAIGLIGATAMAGYIGGGGVGNLALTYGYQMFNTPLMVFTVLVLIVFVQVVQNIGNFLSRKIRNH